MTLLNVGPWCKEALLVFDLAYFQDKLFRQILDHGGHFLYRLKKDANFIILAAKKSRRVRPAMDLRIPVALRPHPA